MTMMSTLDDASGRAAAQQAAEASAALFRALGDPSRLAILAHLYLGPHRVVDLVDHLGLAQSTVSKHLACLRDCGLVVGRPEGRQMFYSIAHPELMDLLAAAEQLLGLTGEAVEICPRYGPVDTHPHPQTETIPTTTEEVAP